MQQSADAPVNVPEFENFARQRLSKMAFDYVAGAAGDEITLRRNRESFSSIRLKPRVLRDVDKLDTRTEVFGQSLDLPILLAPAAYHKLMHPEGELATVRGANAANATMTVSSFATTSIEDMAKVSTNRLWFQLYVQRDRKFTRDLVQRAEAAGCKALVITVDTPVLGARDREAREKFHLPDGMQRENLKSLGERMSRAEHINETSVYSEILDPTLTWEGIDWIHSFAKVPIILKGILSPEDAKLGVQHGAAGILVSNHGARNLDTAPSTIEALPGVIEAVAGKIPVLMDGGVRRGTDVVKAIALGAKAVLIGRPYMWGLAYAGSQGVEQVVTILRNELKMAMALCGISNIAGINRSVIWDGKP
ncbi:MAG: alpha-hydroxy-acid oxidizing protein [Acidobacteria bacterium]|nr:alpha-hydroxy-acid oxidizing protein [Acidobacteriota bacterium]